MQELVPSVKDLHNQDSCANEIFELAVNAVSDEPVPPSKQQEFCWAVVGYCCRLISDTVEYEDFGWLTTYKHTVEIIVGIHDKFASHQPRSQLPSYETYMKCIEKFQSVPKHWSQKLKSNVITYDEILLYLENFDDIFRIANNFNVTEADFAGQQIAENSKQQFNVQFSLLSSYLVPSLETPPPSVW